MITRFTRFAVESHVGVISYSHTGNGDPDTVEHGSDFYNDVLSRREYQACTGVWGEWEEWSNCDRSCHDGIRIRERECSEGDAGWCDGSERDVQVCNDGPCYEWPEKGWTHWEEWSACSVSCGGGKRDRRRTCKNDEMNCGGADYQVGNCRSAACPINQCPLELKINLPDSWHTQELFPYEAYYHRTEENITNGKRPRYIKYAKDIELVYENEAWIMRDNDKNRIMLISFTDALCPEFIAAEDWHYLELNPDNTPGDYKNDQDITFENAKDGDDYIQGDNNYASTGVPTWRNWQQWSSCEGTCGTDAVQTRVRTCRTRCDPRCDTRCVGPSTENRSCNFDSCGAEDQKLPCVADENGIRWRLLYRQWRTNGGIPREHEDSILANEGFTFGANPIQEGHDYINFVGFDSYKKDDFFNLKLVWSNGESITWKQSTSPFDMASQTVAPTTNVIAQNHKNHTEMVFHGLSLAFVTKNRKGCRHHSFDDFSVPNES